MHSPHLACTVSALKHGNTTLRHNTRMQMQAFAKQGDDDRQSLWVESFGILSVWIVFPPSLSVQFSVRYLYRMNYVDILRKSKPCKVWTISSKRWVTTHISSTELKRFSGVRI